jgi:surface protein
MRLTLVIGVVAFSSPWGALAGFVMTDSNIYTARDAWLANPTSAEATYGHISTWETGEVTDMTNLFCAANPDWYGSERCNEAASNFNDDIGDWNVGSVTNMKYMFRGRYTDRGGVSAFNQDIGNWAVDRVTDMWGMFSGASSFNQDLSEWKIDSAVDMRFMFNDASAFNQDLGWCVDKAEQYGSAFSSSGTGDPPLCASTSCGVGDAAALWCGGKMDDSTFRSAVGAWRADATAAEAKYGHISRWKTGGVTSMRGLFRFYYSSFNEDIGSWDTSGVTDMHEMFQDAFAFNQDIGGWAVDNVKSMYMIFEGAKAFDQDLGWCVDHGVSLEDAFKNAKCESTSCGVAQKDIIGICDPWARPCLISSVSEQCIISSPTLIIFILIVVLFAGFGAYVHRRKEEDETYFAAARRLVISFSHSVRDRLTALAYALRNKMEPSSVNSRPDSPADSPRDEPDEEATASESLESRAQAATKAEEAVEPSSFWKLTSFLFGEREEAPTEEEAALPVLAEAEEAIEQPPPPPRTRRWFSRAEPEPAAAPQAEEETAALPVLAEAEEEPIEQPPPPPPARSWFSSAEPEPEHESELGPEPAAPKAEDTYERMADWYNEPKNAALRATWGAFPEPDEFQTWPGFVAVTNAFLDASPSNP